jgi:hypothetical protein
MSWSEAIRDLSLPSPLRILRRLGHSQDSLQIQRQSGLCFFMHFALLWVGWELTPRTGDFQSAGNRVVSGLKLIRDAAGRERQEFYSAMRFHALL